MAESELIDLEEIVKDYASSFLDGDQKKHADLKNPIIDWNRMFVSHGQSQTFERELMWSVDNTITVPPGFQTKAELVIKEDNFNGDFEVPCFFEGTIVVTYENKKREHVATVRDHVKRFFANQKGFTTDDEGRPKFIVKGCCKCRFGVEQSVRLTETPLDAEEAAPGTKALTNAEG